MDEQSQKTFDSILEKDLNSLTEHDIVFLRARRSYLSKEDQKRFKSVLRGKFEESEKESVPSTESEFDLEVMNMAELFDRAQELGVDVEGKTTEEELRAAIRETLKK